jgi:hypothetical protein
MVKEVVLPSRRKMSNLGAGIPDGEVGANESFEVTAAAAEFCSNLFGSRGDGGRVGALQEMVWVVPAGQETPERGEVIEIELFMVIITGFVFNNTVEPPDVLCTIA